MLSPDSLDTRFQKKILTVMVLTYVSMLEVG